MGVAFSVACCALLRFLNPSLRIKFLNDLPEHLLYVLDFALHSLAIFLHALDVFFHTLDVSFHVLDFTL